MKALGSENVDTYVVGAGDMIGGTPLLSGLFHDEPTIEFLNSIGVDTVGVGNHEFDEGAAELLRMQYGNRALRRRRPERRHVVHACAAGRLPSGRRLPGRHAVLRLRLPVPRGERASTGARATRSCRRTRSSTPRPARRSLSSARRSRTRRSSSRRPASPGWTSSTRPTPSTRSIPRLKQRRVETIVLLLHQGGFQNAPLLAAGSTT